MKFSPLSIIQAHRRTYVDARTGRTAWSDVVVAEVLPVLVTAGMLIGRAHLDHTLAGGLVTVTGLMSALLFGVLLQVSQRALDWADTHPSPSAETSAHALYLTELAANAGYASLVALLAAVVLVGATLPYEPAYTLTSSIGTGLLVHLVLILFMIIKRVFALTVGRLNRARTGANPGSNGAVTSKATAAEAESPERPHPVR